MERTQYVSFTAKGLRVNELMLQEGKSIDQALAIADNEFKNVNLPVAAADDYQPRTEECGGLAVRA